MTATQEVFVDPLTVECSGGLQNCGAQPGELCKWPDDLKHMEPNSHWARRDRALEVEALLVRRLVLR